jgi:hypothetical protein
MFESDMATERCRATGNDGAPDVNSRPHGAIPFAAESSQEIRGVMRPADSRRNGASGFAAESSQRIRGVMEPFKV